MFKSNDIPCDIDEGVLISVSSSLADDLISKCFTPSEMDEVLSLKNL